MNKFVSSLIVLALSAPALAVPCTPGSCTHVDEPSGFALMAVAAVAAVAMWRGRK